MKPKRIEIRKRTRKQTHLVEKTIGVVAIVALMVLIGALLMESSWTEEIFSSGNLITGAAVGVVDEVGVPETPPAKTITSGGETEIGIQAGGGELGIQVDANSTSCGNVTGSLTLTANVSTTTDCFTIKASNVVLDCAGFTVSGDGGGTDYGVDNADGYDNITITNCTINNFAMGIVSYNDAYNQIIQYNSFINFSTGIKLSWPTQGTANGTIFNNSFSLPKATAYGIAADDYTSIFNNTFSGSYIAAITIDDDNQIWSNSFWGTEGIQGYGNSSLCVDGIGNFYNGSVDVAQVPAADCGPTPNQTVYVNQSRGASSFTFGGRDATYLDLRTAVYNAWNGTNNIIYLLENHSTAYGQSSTAVHFVRSNVSVNCLGYTYSDPTANSVIYGFNTNGFNDITIHNCTISNFDNGVSISDSQRTTIFNNTFAPGTDANEYYGITLTNGDNSTITNNTFTGDFTSYAMSISSTSTENNISQNLFWGGDGISDDGNNNLCVNGIGNFYNATVAVAGGSLGDQVPTHDCGPTPNGTVYVNQSAGAVSFTWGGTSATYPDLRTAVYNTWNGTNNTIYLLENHNTTYRQNSRAVHFMRGGLNVNCLGHTYSDTDATSDIYAFTTYSKSNINIYNCTISNFNSGLLLSSGTNYNIYNNSFIAEDEQEGIYLSNADNSVIINNTFSGVYSNSALEFDSSSTNNNASQNQFWGTVGIDNAGANNSLCVNGIGNFYNASVILADVIATDCGPTQFGTVYVNQSATINLTWNGTSATYPDLRTAVYNTYNGTNNKIYLLENHSTTYSQSSKAVDFVRSNVDVNCLGYTYSDPTTNSAIDGFDTNSVNNISIHNCTISNFNSGLGLISGTNHQIYNNSFVAGSEIYGIFFSDADYSTIVNNTFSGSYSTDGINLDSSSANNNLSQNQFWGTDGMTNNGANNSLCVNGIGNFYNGSVAIADVLTIDCGPTPNSNVSVNSSISSSSFTFSTSATANPIYKNLQEAYYNLQENRTMFLAENYSTTSTTQTLRNGTTLDCQNKRINSSADAININGEVGTTISNCNISTTGNGVEGITLSSATGNTIVNTEINTTGTTAYGVTFTSSNGNNIINSTFKIPLSNDVYSSSSSNNSIINSVFNRSDLGFTGTGSWIQVQWYVDVNVTNGTSGIANATVNIANFTSASVFNGLTDTNGLIARQTLTEFWQNSSLKTYSTPHNISANKTGYTTNSTLTNLTITNSTTVVLTLINSLYPDLKINNTDLTYTSGTIKQNDTVEVNATVYNLGNANATDANISFYVDSALNQSRPVNITLNTSQLVSFNWTAVGGNHTLMIITDPANTISESNETNNNATSNISVKYVAILQYLSPTGSFPRGKDIAGEDALFEIDNTLTAVSQVYDLYNSSHALSANCSFYFNETLIGTNLTNSSGYCSYTFDKTIYSYGNYNLTVNFTELQSDAVSHTSQIQNTTSIGILVLSITLDTVNHYNGLNYELGEMAVLNISITQNGTAYSPDTVTTTIRGATDPADGPSVYTSTLYNDSTGQYRYTSLVTSTPNGNAVRWRTRINSTALGLIGTASHSDISVNSNDGNLSMNIINSTLNSINGTQLTVKDAALYQLNLSINTTITNYPIRKDKNHTLEFIATSGEVVMLERVNLNQTNNNLTLQIISAYNGSLPSSLKNLTSITAFESFPYNVTNGNITLPKNGKVVTSIVRCNNWNSTTATCTGNWSTYATAFAENSTHIWFNITSFSGYAGGVPFSSNLTIWDQGDTGMPLGGLSTPINQQLQFYANYTNSTSRADIRGASCNISFSTAPTGPFNMSYNATYSIYQYNRSFSSAGTYLWNVTCSNNTYDTLTANDTISITSDNSPNVTLISPATSYSNQTGTLTNITFYCNATDDNQLVNISLYLTNSTNQSFALNRSTNISGATNSSNWTLELGRGNYTWNCLAYDNASQQGWGAANRSILLLPDTTLPYFNPQPTSQTVEFGTAFSYDVNASDNINVDTFAVNDTNFTINGSGYIINASNLIVKIYYLNISVNDTSGNVNSTIINITVQDTIAPAFTTLSNSSITYGNALSTQFNASDLSGISTWWINNTANFAINSTVGLLTNNGTIAVGAYQINLSVNDTYNNINSTTVTVTVNAASSSSSSSGGGGGSSSSSSSSSGGGEITTTPSRETTITPTREVPIERVALPADRIREYVNRFVEVTVDAIKVEVAPRVSTEEVIETRLIAQEEVVQITLENKGDEVVTLTQEVRAPDVALENEAKTKETIAQESRQEVTQRIDRTAITPPQEVESRSVQQQDIALVSLENNGDKTLSIVSEIAPTDYPLEREEKVEEQLEDKVLAEMKDRGDTLTSKEIELLAREKLESVKLLEQENVQPISRVKQGTFLRLPISTIQVSNEPINGRLLKPRIEKEDITLKPGERKLSSIKINTGVSVRANQVNKVIFSSDGKEVLEKEIEINRELYPGTAVDVVEDYVDVYMAIPAREVIAKDSNNAEPYLLEINLVKPDAGVLGLGKTIYSDLYGPFSIKTTEGFVFAQQLRYDKNLKPGKYQIITRIYRDGTTIAKNEFEVTVLSSEDRRLARIARVAALKAAGEKVNESIIYGTESPEELREEFIMQETEKMVKDKLGSLKLIEGEGVQMLGRNKWGSLFGNALAPIHTSRELITGRLLQPTTEEEEEDIVLQPGEKRIAELTITKAVSAKNTTKSELVFTYAGKDVLQKEVELTREVYPGTAVDAVNNHLDVYMTIPAQPDAVKESKLMHYSLELNLIKPDEESEKMNVLFTDLYGPYLVKPQDGFVFAQQFRYDEQIKPGKYIVMTKIYQDTKVIAKNEYEIVLGEEGEESLPLTGSALSGSISVGRKGGILVLMIILTTIGISLIPLGKNYYMNWRRKRKK